MYFAWIIQYYSWMQPSVIITVYQNLRNHIYNWNFPKQIYLQQWDDDTEDIIKKYFIVYIKIFASLYDIFAH